MRKLLATFITSLLFLCATAQARWQQRAEYKMDVELNNLNHQFKGKQLLTYFNNSPDELKEVFYHLYFNAFQPGSSMDVRSRTISDPDSRVGDRISKLKSEEYGFLHVKSLKMDGKEVKFVENETILEVTLDKAIAPSSKVVFEVEFEGQVPIQIRRSGRNNAEGVDYSMTQWYPKMCEYDVQGWHSNPYVGREFYGVWGDFEVNITMDKSYVIGGTGVLQNPLEIGHGYAEDETKVKKVLGPKLVWKFKAQNVHDFAWAADPDFIHDKTQVPGGPMLHFFYLKDKEYSATWKDLQPIAVRAFDFMSKNYGVYPYSQYSIVQGGDGGMEYPMATLITGNRKLPSLVGVTVHEACHSWYQGVLGTNESLYCWMDEGFTSFATSETMDYLFQGGKQDKHRSAYSDYVNIVKDGAEEALDTHADHYVTNYAYNTAAYSKGEVYLTQLEYVVGTFDFRAGLLDYFNTWKFRHPTPADFLHVLEKRSGMELDWYNEYFYQTTKTIDYSITEIKGDDKKTSITVTRKGLMPMPIDLEVKYKDGTTQTFYIPMDLMRGEKPSIGSKGTWTVMKDWSWVAPDYQVEITKSAMDIESVTIDPSGYMADVNRENNVVSFGEGMKFIYINH
jgi:hypothetical protein